MESSAQADAEPPMAEIIDTATIQRRRALIAPKMCFSRVRVFHVSWDDLEALWVSGLAILFILLGNLVFRNLLHVTGKAGDWAFYLLLGTGFPLAIAGLTLVPRQATGTAGFARLVRRLLAIFPSIMMAVLLVTARETYLLILVTIHMIVVVIQRSQEGDTATPRFLVLSVVVLFLSWLGAARLSWWAPYDTWIFGSNYASLIFVVTMLLVATHLSSPSLREQGTVILGRSKSEAMRTLAGMLLISVASMRVTPPLAQSEGTIHHWGVFVGPVALVRQGGWLLWDVPSQYGFLSILSIAALPAKSGWESLYIMNSFLLFCSACFIFFLLRLCRRGIANFWFSLVVSIASVFLICGWTPALLGPNVFPSIGALRFIWCYALLAVLLWEVLQGESRPRWLVLIVGCVVWLLGSLWSAESAVYCTAIWVPAYVLIVVRTTFGGGRSSWQRSVGVVASWLALPVVLLVLTIGGITGYYLVRLGTAPDWRLYGAFISAYSTGQFSRLLSLGGAVCGLFIVFCALSTLAALLLRHGPWHAGLPLVTGAWGALWAVSSYFVGRSVDTNVTNLSPLICAAIAVILFILARYQLSSMWEHLIRLSLIPVIVVQLTLPFGNLAGMRDYLTAPQTGYRGNIDQELPVLDKDMMALFTKAQVKPTDPIIFFDTSKYLLLPAWPIKDGDRTDLISMPQLWLPVAPMVPFVVLPPERSKAIIARFTQRRHLSGWLVQSKTAPYTRLPWFAEQLATTHIATETVESGVWQMIWFQAKGTPDGGSHTMRQSPPPPDILLNGKTQVASSSPISAIYGDGWYDYEVSPNGSGRWAHSPATILMQSTEARDVQLTMTPINFLPNGAGGLGNRGILSVAVDDGTSTEVLIQIGQPLIFSVHLHAGQNMVTLRLAAGNFTPQAIDPHSDTRSLSFSIAGIDITTR